MTAQPWPSCLEVRDLRVTRLDLARWHEGLAEIADALTLAGAPVSAESGSLPVFLYPTAVIKLYAPDRAWRPEGSPTFSTDFAVERSSLASLAGSLPVPAILGEGARDGWRWLAQGRVPGAPLETLGAAPETFRAAGALLRRLHDHPATGIVPSVPDFPRFARRQVRLLLGGGLDVPDPWRGQLTDLFDDASFDVRRPRVLHTEIAPGHLLADARDGVRLTGWIDWVETMVGDPDYDLAVAAFFLTQGDDRALGAFLDGYDHRGPRGVELSRRLLRHLLIHRFARFSWLAQRRPPLSRRLDDLAVEWMGLAD